LNCQHSFSVFSYFLSGSCSGTYSVAPFDPGIGASAYLFFFGLTCLFEWTVYRSLLRTLVLNLLTHPFVVWLLPGIMRRGGLDYGTYLLTAEALAPGLEAAALALVFRIRPLRAMGLALLANLVSWLVGGELVQFAVRSGWLRFLGY
jgi:hypothetical protein